ncbi:MAG: hypothetical protein A3G64_01315 [Candidatus Liptonbacteria bacterium RIFCSPLOWO2_12_FULL_60_15]|uniref:Transketolase-like pyrimidine-binding domain-containing protein n=1 Tax=Candidatus Liptonbacteria bacterium RIFCSPLOWO2_12_FULL_60_15 TaxID=1798653 RepID=A0A1G2CQZ5_9BACT|nr:MAG: hypothetical protein A3G64_01315 [Candidatus Liptonbacteria bacterium RIFCSPLOWO2_12_FULL_60_15]
MNRSYTEAINAALRDVMRDDGSVILLGEDIGELGGRFGATQGLLASFGRARVVDTPLVEDLLAGMALGAANGGLKPIVEFVNADFLAIALDDLWRAGLWQSLYGRDFASGVVVRSCFGGYAWKGPHLSSAAVGHLIAIPNVKLFAPFFPDDAYEIVRRSVREGGLTVILEHRALLLPGIPYEPYDLGRAADLASSHPGDIERASVLPNAAAGLRDIALVSYSYTSLVCLEAAARLEAGGVTTRVVDMKAIWPFDRETIRSVAAESRGVVLVEECAPHAGLMVHVEQDLRRALPNIRCASVHAKDDVVPFGDRESSVLPSAADIISASRSLLV